MSGSGFGSPGGNGGGAAAAGLSNPNLNATNFNAALHGGGFGFSGGDSNNAAAALQQMQLFSPQQPLRIFSPLSNRSVSMSTNGFGGGGAEPTLSALEAFKRLPGGELIVNLSTTEGANAFLARLGRHDLNREAQHQYMTAIDAAKQHGPLATAIQEGIALKTRTLAEAKSRTLSLEQQAQQSKTAEHEIERELGEFQALNGSLNSGQQALVMIQEYEKNDTPPAVITKECAKFRFATLVANRYGTPLTAREIAVSDIAKCVWILPNSNIMKVVRTNTNARGLLEAMRDEVLINKPGFADYVLHLRAQGILNSFQDEHVYGSDEFNTETNCACISILLWMVPPCVRWDGPKTVPGLSPWVPIAAGTNSAAAAAPNASLGQNAATAPRLFSNGFSNGRYMDSVLKSG